MNQHSKNEVRTGTQLRDKVRGLVRDELLQAAESIFAEEGLQTAKVESIAARAGVSVGTVYNYFADRKALVDAVMEFAQAGPVSPPAGARDADRGPALSRAPRGDARDDSGLLQSQRPYFLLMRAGRGSAFVQTSPAEPARSLQGPVWKHLRAPREADGTRRRRGLTPGRGSKLLALFLAAISRGVSLSAMADPQVPHDVRERRTLDLSASSCMAPVRPPATSYGRFRRRGHSWKPQPHRLPASVSSLPQPPAAAPQPEKRSPKKASSDPGGRSGCGLAGGWHLPVHHAQRREHRRRAGRSRRHSRGASGGGSRGQSRREGQPARARRRRAVRDSTPPTTTPGWPRPKLILRWPRRRPRRLTRSRPSSRPRPAADWCRPRPRSRGLPSGSWPPTSRWRPPKPQSPARKPISAKRSWTTSAPRPSSRTKPWRRTAWMPRRPPTTAPTPP